MTVVKLEVWRMLTHPYPSMNNWLEASVVVPEPYQAGSFMPESELFWRAFWQDMGKAYRPARAT